MTADHDAKKGEQRTICDDCGNANLAHDRAVWMDDGSSYCPTCQPAHTDDKRAHSPFANSVNPDRDALVEEMARVICKAHGEQPEQAKFYRHEASAALDIAMEEAARFTTAQAQAFRDDAHNRKQFGDKMMHKRGLAIAACFDQHAAAIRAYKSG